MVYESRPELQPSFAELAADPVPVLELIEDHMTTFASAWDNYLATASLASSARRACEADRAAFGDEIRRFRRGLQLIRDDLAGTATGIGAAFIRANEAVALMNTDGGLDNPGRGNRHDVAAVPDRLRGRQPRGPGRAGGPRRPAAGLGTAVAGSPQPAG